MERVGEIVKVQNDKAFIIVPLEKPDIYKFEKQEIKKAIVRFDDGRTISAEQRAKIYAILGDISEWQYDYMEIVKNTLKNEFLALYGYNYFSLSDCTMTIATEFINFLIDFCFLQNIPTRDTMLNRTDDISHYLYSCLANRKCCICNGKGEIHHCEGSRVGMGFDRNKIDNIGRNAICLCRKHHNQAHQSEKEFFEKYKVYGIKLDEYLVKKLKL